MMVVMFFGANRVFSDLIENPARTIKTVNKIILKILFIVSKTCFGSSSVAIR